MSERQVRRSSNTDLAEVAGVLVPLERMRHDGAHVDVTTEVARQVAKVGALLNNRASALRLVPPIRLQNRVVGVGVTRNGSHDGEVVVLDDLLHHLRGLEVAKHVPGAR